MKRIGYFIALLGASSIILNFFDYEFRYLMWVENWGETVGWIIRIGLIVLGAVLVFAGSKQKS